MGRFSKEENEDEIKLRYHLAHILHKQKNLLQVCKALMLYGAPTHRLGEYLKMSARVLDVEGEKAPLVQFHRSRAFDGLLSKTRAIFISHRMHDHFV